MRPFTIRRYVAFVVPALFFVLCFSLYLMMESVSMHGESSYESKEQNEKQLENKLHQIEEDLKTNQKTIIRIKELIHDIAKNNGYKNWNQILDDNIQDFDAVSHNGSSALIWRKNEVKLPEQYCKLARSVPPKVDIQMFDVLHNLPFDNPDGGVWKQGYPINYDAKQWKTEKLKVFIIPHSHDDPGWIKTFDAYYKDQTRHILNLMVEKLEAYPAMRFVYAEISFFSLWWSDLDDNMRSRVKRLIAEKRLEIVTGGWVMTDEANAHYFAMLDQMIEGNQWLQNQLGIRPTSGWAVDPFGYSPTMAYLLHQIGFKNMLIQRVHYSVKKHLSQNKQLEFLWRQNWDLDGGTDMFCHLMPFYSYDIPHTCGPNPKVCCQFDFKRLEGGSFKCPWNIPPVVIDGNNVAERAEMLLDQYRQKSQLYKNNIVLVPLGDDFRYDKADEWDNQHNNYRQLFEYINAKSELNAEVRFATLTDYFDALRERAGKNGVHDPAGYPVLSGDFFTYADRDDHYWSGYFTSRPFYKGLDRVLESHLRGGEILFSLALAEARRLSIGAFQTDALLTKLVSARRNLGLFQHHDAITGTAKDHVVVDYGLKLLNSIDGMKKVIMDSAHFLLTADKAKYSHQNAAFFDVDETRSSHDALPEKTVILVSSEPHVIVFYNSLAQNRTSSVTVLVNVPYLEIRDTNNVVVPTQVSPHWTTSEKISTTIYRVSFVVTLPGLGLVKYTVVETKSNPQNSFAKVTIYNSEEKIVSQVGPFSVEKQMVGSTSSKITVENAEMKLFFSPDSGMLKEVMLKDSGDIMKTEVQLVRYGTRPGKERSGAYLFISDSEAKPLHYSANPTIRVTEGVLLSEVQLLLPLVDHVVKVVNSPGVDSSAIEIMNLVDIRRESNTEIAMRVITDINSDGEFFSDLNGFQVLRRKTLDKLPLQANFYPMSTMAYIENEKHRFTLLSGQSLGVASLKNGWLEVMQDRRLDQDDHRGLGQPVHDNKVTPNLFRFLIERQQFPETSVAQAAAYPSLQCHLVSQQTLHPVHILPALSSVASAATSDLLSSFEPLQLGLPCDVHMVNLRTLLKPEDHAGIQPADETGLILHRLGVDCRFPVRGVFCPVADGQMTLSSLFKDLRFVEAHSSGLSLTENLSSVEPSSAIDVPPMEIRAFTVRVQ